MNPSRGQLSPATTMTSWIAVVAAITFTSNADGGEVRSSDPGKLEAPIRIPIKELPKLEGPEVVDFDGDGKMDLLSADYSGHLFLRTNIGTAKKPEFSAPRKLKAGTDVIKIKHW